MKALLRRIFGFKVHCIRGRFNGASGRVYASALDPAAKVTTVHILGRRYGMYTADLREGLDWAQAWDEFLREEGQRMRKAASK